MIVYFADRQLNIIGQASTELPDGLVISSDKKISEIETGVSTFACDITFDKKTRSKVEECTQCGNYILRSHDGETELYTIIDAEIDTKKQEVYIYAEDDGMDLLNEVVGVYEADKAYPIDHYINKYAKGAGFEIGINEAKGLTRQLSWDGESTATARIASVATQFDGCEISFSFEVDGLYVVKKYINIYKQRGKDIGVTLRLNQDIDSIITSKSIGNLATALQCTGGTIDQSSTILEDVKSSGSPQVAYTVDLKCIGRTKTAVTFNATVSAALTNEDAKLAEDYGLKASIFIGGSWHSATLKATSGDNKREWSGTASNSVEYEFTAPASSAGVVTYSGIKLKVERTDSKGGSIGVLSEKACNDYTVPNYIEGGDNGEDIESRNITLEGYAYNDGDFYVDGNVLKSKNALQNWSRVVWKTEESQKNGGHITKLYSYDTPSQQTLCNRAITELKKLREMEINYDVEIKKFPDNVKIGDRVNIVDDAGELYVSARVLKLEQSVSDDEHKATLGEYLIKSSGIHQKVAELAEQFAKAAVSASRALSIANNAKTAAAEAKKQAQSVSGDIQAAQQAAEAAQQAANSANESASNAQEKAVQAEQAVDRVEQSVSDMEQTIANAQQAAQQAQQAAQTAETKASEAQQAAVNAQAKADEATTAAGNAQAKAESATEKAETAKTTAEQAIANAEQAATTAAAAKQDAENAQKDIDSLGDDLTTLENTMTADYARKTDLTESEAKLQTQITQNASEISSTASKVQKIDETANDAAEQAQSAQAAAGAAQAQADQAKADAQAAQTAADNAAAAAQAAQSEADTAKAAAATAQGVADQAEADLEAAKADLATVTSRVDSTEEEIAAAQQAVTAAQTAADNAQAEADAAAKKATDAQSTADTAVANAAAAQTTANDATSKANLAQQTANAAKGDAAAAQQAAAEAAETAAEAQRTANTAVSNAATAQAAADKAKQDAATAQKAAEDADARAEQAATDLATAQQNLAAVTSRVDATEEEIAAAQQAVQTAQAAADKAKQDAQAAQSTADTAKANAATAQAAADNAKAAADQAQADAAAAQKAADDAQADVDALAVRVTNAETQITQTNKQISLLATKEEVTQTLGGYYTKTQTDAAIVTKANEINLSVDSKIEGVQVGGRNLLKNSRHIGLLSNNNATYPVSHSTVTENGREFRRYRRTETTLSPTTMSLYSSIPVTEITDVLTGQEITFSFLIRCSHSVNTTIMCAIVVDGTSYNWASNYTQNAIGTEWKRLSVTATIEQEYERNGSNLLRFNPLAIAIPSGEIENFYLDVCEWKIEKGNKATDWSPAPEDLDDKFSNYSTTEEMNAAIDLKADGIVSTVKSTYTTKEDFANLDVGGRNFVRDSSLKEKTDLWSFDTNNTYSFENGYCEVFRDTTSGSRTFNNQSTNKNALLKPETLPGGTFTLSAEIKLLDGYSITDSSTLFYRCNTTELSSGFQELAIKLGGATTEWKKVHSTFTFGEYNFDGSCQVCIALANVVNTGICIRNIKLEKGNKATDWTPAPEDTATDVHNLQETVGNYASYEERITAAETSINQLADSISMLVQKEDKSSRMEFDEDSATWSFNTGEIDNKISTNAGDIEDLKSGANDTNENVEKLQDKLDSWEEHISITTYEDEPCLLLYEEDSNYKQYVTNTRRIITENVDGTETVKSEVGIDTATYQNVVAKEKVQVGGFAWKKRGTNRISLVWEGE